VTCRRSRSRLDAIYSHLQIPDLIRPDVAVDRSTTSTTGARIHSPTAFVFRTESRSPFPPLLPAPSYCFLRSATLLLLLHLHRSRLTFLLRLSLVILVSSRLSFSRVRARFFLPLTPPHPSRSFHALFLSSTNIRWFLLYIEVHDCLFLSLSLSLSRARARTRNVLSSLHRWFRPTYPNYNKRP